MKKDIFNPLQELFSSKCREQSKENIRRYNSFEYK